MSKMSHINILMQNLLLLIFLIKWKQGTNFISRHWCDFTLFIIYYLSRCTEISNKYFNRVLLVVPRLNSLLVFFIFDDWIFRKIDQNIFMLHISVNNIMKGEIIESSSNLYRYYLNLSFTKYKLWILFLKLKKTWTVCKRDKNEVNIVSFVYEIMIACSL